MGYTSSLAEAGLYNKSDAIERTTNAEGVTMKHVDSLLIDIDYERKLLRAKLAGLDAAERNVLGLHADVLIEPANG